MVPIAVLQNRGPPPDYPRRYRSDLIGEDTFRVHRNYGSNCVETSLFEPPPTYIESLETSTHNQ